MKVELIGHDEKYAVEQSLLTLFPTEKPVYGAVDPTADPCWARITLTEEDERVQVTTELGQDGKSAVTHYRPLRQDGTYTLVELTLETGRTHQIRVHMAWLGYPLAGDTLYGGSTAHFSRHMLHCCRVAFPDPESGGRITAECPFQACEAYFAAAKI